MAKQKPAEIHVDIIYGDTCPGQHTAPLAVESSLASLREKLEASGLTVQADTWQIPDSGDPYEGIEASMRETTPPRLLKNGQPVEAGFTIPPTITGWASPAVLVNGVNVTGQEQAAAAFSSCSMKQPTQELVTTVLDAAIEKAIGVRQQYTQDDGTRVQEL